VKRHALVLGLLLSLTTALVAVRPATADVAVTQQGVIVGDKPVSGRYAVSWTNYGEKKQNCYGAPPHPTCLFIGYRVARGKITTKLRTYKIKDGLRKYDFYLLDVDMMNVNRSGSSKLGDASISIDFSNATLVDYTQSKSMNADEPDCHSVDVTFSTPFPYVSASTSLGEVEWCDEHASLLLTKAGDVTWYAADHLATIKHFMMDRAVKVAKGQRPRFTVHLTVPNDDCTKASDGWCKQYSNGIKTRTYKVGTSGG
jgi:hypothetical protein